MDDGVRMPPQNLNAERAVLGSMTMAEEAAEYGVANLNESDFYSVAHTMIFRCIKSLLAAKVQCDPVTMADQLAKTNQLEEVGGVGYIVEIIESVPTWAHMRHYSNIVKRESVRRRLIQLSLQAQDSCYDPSIELEPLISKLSGKLDDLVAERSNDLQSVAAVVQQMREE